MVAAVAEAVVVTVTVFYAAALFAGILSIALSHSISLSLSLAHCYSLLGPPLIAAVAAAAAVLCCSLWRALLYPYLCLPSTTTTTSFNLCRLVSGAGAATRRCVPSFTVDETIAADYSGARGRKVATGHPQ